MGGGGGGGKRGTVHCLIPLCPPPHSPRGFAVAQNFTKRDSTITPATQATTFMKKTHRLLFTGRFGGLTGRPGDLIKNLETPGKTGRVGRYVDYAHLHKHNKQLDYISLCLSLKHPNNNNNKL